MLPISIFYSHWRKQYAGAQILFTFTHSNFTPSLVYHSVRLHTQNPPFIHFCHSVYYFNHYLLLLQMHILWWNSYFSPFIQQHFPLLKWPSSTSSHPPILFLSTSSCALSIDLHTSFNYNRCRYSPPSITTFSTSLIHTSPLFSLPPFHSIYNPRRYLLLQKTQAICWSSYFVVCKKLPRHSLQHMQSARSHCVILEDWRKEEKYLSLHLRVVVL